MPRQKNDGRGRLGGRAKGTPNKVTTDLKTWIASILDDGRGRFVEDLGALQPIERVKIYVTLLNYIIPKQQAVEANVTDQKIEAAKSLFEDLLRIDDDPPGT